MVGERAHRRGVAEFGYKLEIERTRRRHGAIAARCSDSRHGSENVAEFCHLWRGLKVGAQLFNLCAAFGTGQAAHALNLGSEIKAGQLRLIDLRPVL